MLRLGAVVSIAALLVVIIVIIQQRNSNSTEPVSRYQRIECWFTIPEQPIIECGQLQSQGLASTFVLPVVIFKSNTTKSTEVPLVYLNGGPGSDNYLSSDGIDQWLGWLETANLSRDLVVMEMRGTGGAKPQFRCQNFENNLRNSLQENLSMDAEAIALNNTLSICIDQFEQQGFYFDDFTTSAYADDLHRLLNSLPYTQFNILGSSYGTRLAIDYARRYPGDVRAMILDSVYPPGKGGLLFWPEKLATSFDSVWQNCVDSNVECRDVGVSADEFWQLIKQLNTNPLTVTVSLWNGGWPVNVVVNGHRFLFASYSALYRTSGPKTIADAVQEIKTGNISALTQLVEQSVNSDLDPTFNPFTFFVVDCAENYRPTAAEFETVRVRYPRFSEVTRGAVAQDACQHYPLRNDLEYFNQITIDETPVLFLSGGLDPVTPAGWVDDLKSAFPNGQHWVFPQISHGVSANNDCVLEHLNDFLDSPFDSHSNPCLNE